MSIGRSCPKKPVEAPESFFTYRPGSGARGSALRELTVLVADASRIVDLEARMRFRRHLLYLHECLRPALDAFDFVLLDMPANVTKSNRLVMGGLIMGDFVAIPVVPASLSLNALSITLDSIDLARSEGRIDQPRILGMVRNRTDRRAQQYRRCFPDIERAIEAGKLPPMFKNYLPDAHALETATDGTMGFRTLKNRFAGGSPSPHYYECMRRVAIEFSQRCNERAARKKREPWRREGLASRIIRTILRRS